MKINTKLQTGSAHAVIIGILFIALMATLGVVFYQNFIAKTDEKVAAPSNEQPAENKVKTVRAAFNSSIYALDYPEDWKATTKKLEGSANTIETKIVSPNKKVRVDFTITDGGMGGACDINDGLKIGYYTVHKTEVKNLTDESLYVVEGLYDNPGGGYQYTIGLTPEGGDTHAKVGDSHCNIQKVGIASSLLLAQGGVIVHPTIIAKITFPTVTKSPEEPLKEMQPVKDLIATTEYKEAVKILESARKE